MNTNDQIPAIDKKRLELQNKINLCTGVIFEIENAIREMEKKHIAQVNKRRMLSIELSEISTFELNFDKPNEN